MGSVAGPSTLSTSGTSAIWFSVEQATSRVHLPVHSVRDGGTRLPRRGRTQPCGPRQSRKGHSPLAVGTPRWPQDNVPGRSPSHTALLCLWYFLLVTLKHVRPYARHTRGAGRRPRMPWGPCWSSTCAARWRAVHPIFVAWLHTPIAHHSLFQPYKSLPPPMPGC